MEDDQFNEWHDVFVTIARVRNGEISEVQAFDILSKKYVLVSTCTIDNIIKNINENS